VLTPSPLKGEGKDKALLKGEGAEMLLPCGNSLGVDGVADESQGGFEVASGGLEGVRVDRQGSAENDERGAVAGAGDGLFEGETADRLNGNVDGVNDLFELIEGTWHTMTRSGDASTFVITDVMDDVVTAKVLEHLRSRDHVFTAEVIAHDFAVEILARIDDALDRLSVSAGHDNDVRRPCLCHHLGFEIAAIHGFEVRDDRNAWKFFSQGTDSMEPFCKDQRSPRFEPVDSGAQRHASGGNGFFDVGEIQRDLNDRFHGVVGNPGGMSSADCTHQ